MTGKSPNSDARRCAMPCGERRRLLASALATTVAGLAVSFGVGAARDPDDPRRQPPQPGDVLAWPSWEHDGRPVRADEVVLHGRPLSVYPSDASTGVVRERSRLNQILLARFDPAELSERTAAGAADGIVAYSGVCTHTACGVSEWSGESRHFVCPCHASEFDPRNGAAVVGGPAPRALPALPIRREGDVLLVRDGFTSRVGARNS